MVEIQLQGCFTEHPSQDQHMSLGGGGLYGTDLMV